MKIFTVFLNVTFPCWILREEFTKNTPVDRYAYILASVLTVLYSHIRWSSSFAVIQYKLFPLFCLYLNVWRISPPLIIATPDFRANIIPYLFHHLLFSYFFIQCPFHQFLLAIAIWISYFVKNMFFIVLHSKLYYFIYTRIFHFICTCSHVCTPSCCCCNPVQCYYSIAYPL